VSCAIADLVLIGDFVFAQNVFILLHVDASSCGNCARHQNVSINQKICGVFSSYFCFLSFSVLLDTDRLVYRSDQIFVMPFAQTHRARGE
jgi:hypothetical protein